jgi:hypothetical protein
LFQIQRKKIWRRIVEIASSATGAVSALALLSGWRF